MAITGYMESSLATSEIFQGINNSIKGGENTTQKAINLIKNAKRLTVEDIETAYISVRQITDSLTRTAMRAFDNERTILLYNNVPDLSVTQTLPFITFKDVKKNDYTTYVFMDKYIQINRDNVMTIQAPILRDLLIAALISNGLKRNYNIMASNQYLQKVLMEIYTKFITRILNREFSIMADKVTFDVIQYWVNRFFLTTIMGANDLPENLEKLSSSSFRYIEEMKYEEIKNAYNESNPTKISELLELLKTASPRMRTLNLMRFLSDWINYYYVESALAIDDIEYLLFMILALLAGNNTLVSMSATDIVKDTKNIKSLRGELLKIV